MNPQPTTSFSINDQDSGSLLALSVELEGVRVCLLENVSGQYRLAGWLGVQNDPASETPQQLANACRRLGERLGRRLWNDVKQEPFWESDDPARWPPLAHVSLGMTARPRLRVWLAGLSNAGSLATLQQVVSSSPVHVVGSTQVTAYTNSGQLAAELMRAQPEVLVIAGGYDTAEAAAQPPLLALCTLVGQAVAELEPDQRPALFFAGNRFVAPQAEVLLRAGDGALQLSVLDNVQPAPGVISQNQLANPLGYYHWRLSERLPGFALVSRWVTSPGQVSSLTANFAQLIRIWMEVHHLPELHGLYCTSAGWLHGWACQGREGIRLCYVEPNSRPALVRDWPSLQLVSGDWPLHLWPAPVRYWWDRSSLAPVIASIGQVAPRALVQALKNDVFELRRGETR